MSPYCNKILLIQRLSEAETLIDSRHQPPTESPETVTTEPVIPDATPKAQAATDKPKPKPRKKPAKKVEK